MFNIKSHQEGNTLYLAIDLSEKHGPTKSGKGTVIANTVGFRNVPANPKLGLSLMLYERNDKAAATS